MTVDDEHSEYRRRLDERETLLQRVDAIPSEKEVSFRLTKGDVALLIRSQSLVFDAIERVVRHYSFERMRPEPSDVKKAVARARQDFDVVTQNILQQIAEQADD